MSTSNSSRIQPSSDSSRRDFLAGVCAISVGAAVARAADQPPAAPAPPAATPLPQMPFGRHTISRLVCGANPFNAGSHLSVFVNNELRAYFTPEQILKTLHRCQQVGFTAWQSSGANYELYKRFRDQGGTMKYISLGENVYGNSAAIDNLVKAGCIAVAHHGEATDQFFKRGELDKVNDYLKRVRDAGLMAGVSTHMPAVVDAIESKGWDIEFYMTCVYERHRSAQDLQKLLGAVPIPVGEVYLQQDPPRMFKAIRASKRPCLAFKILAAGRLSERREWVEQAFRQTYESIKPNDGVIIGIFDKYSDQPAEDAEFARKYAAASATA